MSSERLRTLAVVVFVAAAVLLVAPTPAGAKTTVTVKGEVVTITVPIDCAGCKGKKGPDGSDLADYWAKTAETAWNDAFAKFPYGCSKFKFELDVRIDSKSADFKGKKGNHLVQVAGPSGGRLAGVGWEGQQEQNPAGNTNQASPDGTRFYDGDHDGTLTEDATPTVITHEIGHAMGLGDDRDKSGDAIPGREGTLMVGGAKDVTPDTPLKIDQTLIDRIGQQLEKLRKIDKCERWSGKTEGVSQPDYCPPSSISGSLSLTVAKDGAVTGTGHTTTTPYTCNPPGGSYSVPSASEDLTLTGQKTKKAFTLQTIVFAGTVRSPTITIPIHGGSAVGDLPGSLTSGKVKETYSLTCQTCGK